MYQNNPYTDILYTIRIFTRLQVGGDFKGWEEALLLFTASSKYQYSYLARFLCVTLNSPSCPLNGLLDCLCPLFFNHPAFSKLLRPVVMPGPQIRMRNWKVFFLFFSQNIYCEYSKEPSRWDGWDGSEPSRRDGSIEDLKHMFKLMDKKIIAMLQINQKLRSVTLFTILICCSRKKGLRHLFTFTIKALTYTYVPAELAHFTHSASIVWNRKTQRSLVRGRGISIR